MMITWDDFEKVQLVVGTIIEATEFPEARNPSYKLMVDLGGGDVRRSSAQITHLYATSELVGKQVLCVTNFPPKQIGPFISELLVCGFKREDGAVVLAGPDFPIENGTPLT